VELNVPGQPIALALRPDTLVVQSREPASLVFFPRTGPGRAPEQAPTVVVLSNDSREDTGHAIFHSNSGAGIACASCHGEGGDDGHLWQFDSVGDRRTPSLLGTLAGTAPYHWAGEEKDISQLALDVLTGNMSGPTLDAGQTAALQSWLFALPGPTAATGIDASSAERGRALFNGTAGCASCHSGPMLTNSATVDVGTGGAFQVPSLVGVAARTPLFHDGCAATLADRFGECATATHGQTSQLSAGDIADLVSYLETL
jgi:cytochrome c peroxidase